MKRNIEICRDCVKFSEHICIKKDSRVTRYSCDYDSYGITDFDAGGNIIGMHGDGSISHDDYVNWDLPAKCPMQLEHMVIHETK